MEKERKRVYSHPFMTVWATDYDIDTYLYIRLVYPHILKDKTLQCRVNVEGEGKLHITPTDVVTSIQQLGLFDETLDELHDKSHEVFDEIQGEWEEIVKSLLERRGLGTHYTSIMVKGTIFNPFFAGKNITVILKCLIDIPISSSTFDVWKTEGKELERELSSSFRKLMERLGMKLTEVYREVLKRSDVNVTLYEVNLFPLDFTWLGKDLYWMRTSADITWVIPGTVREKLYSFFEQNPSLRGVVSLLMFTSQWRQDPLSVQTFFDWWEEMDESGVV